MKHNNFDATPFKNKNILLTGGAGVIGSRLVELLCSKDDNFNNLTILDNLSSSSLNGIAQFLSNPNVKFLKTDITMSSSIKNVMADVDVVIHLAANADVRYRENLGTDLDLKMSTVGTYNILEEMRRCDTKYLLFSSSSSVYGRAEVFPTSETYGPLLPESLYAASKLASEGLISAFSSMFGIRSKIFRFANITAGTFRSKGSNVIPDFINKLRNNGKRLEILGNGEQEKSYLHVDDCIRGMFELSKNMDKSSEIFNLGNMDTTKVNTIAKIVVEEMGLHDVEFVYSGGSTGWTGDIPKTFLDVRKASARGWKPSLSSEEAVRISARSIIRNTIK